MRGRSIRWAILALVTGLIVAGYILQTSRSRPCSATQLQEARSEYPDAIFDDDGVVMARLDGIDDVYHPQAAMLFVTDALKKGDIDPATDCVIRSTGRWLISSLEQSGDAWYWFYPFDWPYGDSDELLSRAPWPSGLAQGNGLIALGMLADYTGDPAYDEAAHRAFSAFTADDSRIRTTLPDGGLFFQEYETAIPTFVLNGNLDALIGVAGYAKRYDDQEAWATFRRGIDGLRELLPRFSVTTPQGEVSAYDLIRLHPDLRLRVSGGSATVDLSNPQGFSASATIEPSLGDAPELITNGGFEQLDASGSDRPEDWKAIITAGGDNFAFPDSDAHEGRRFAQITTSGEGWEVLGQTVGTEQVGKGAYGISFYARAPRPLRVPGRVTVVGECPSGRSILGDKFQIRSRQWAPYGFVFDVPEEGCDLLVELYEFTSSTAGGVIDFDSISLRRLDDRGTALGLPLSVYEQPSIHISRSGDGGLKVFYEGAWRPLEVTDGELPMYLQGRNIHFGYHDGHVRQLRKLYSLSGEGFLLEYATRWAAMTPDE